MAEYQGPIQQIGNIRVEVKCYTRADAKLRLELYKWAALLIGAFLGFVIVGLFRYGGLIVLDFIRRFFPESELGRALIEIIHWLMFNFMWVWIFMLLVAVLLGILIGYFLWKKFIAANHCNCPAGVEGFCLAFHYRIAPVLGIPVLVFVRTAPQHCQVIPPGCP